MAEEYDLPHLVLSTFYGLNKSFSKKIFVGFNLNESKKKFSLEYRICGNDINSGFISLNYSGWMNFKELFPRINDYLINRTENQDETLSFDNFTVRFTKSFWERAIEISSEEEKNDGKKVKKSLVMKRVTFEILKNITPLIDDKFHALFDNRYFLYVLKNTFIEYIISSLSEGNKKLVSHISPDKIRSICGQIDEKTTQ